MRYRRRLTGSYERCPHDCLLRRIKRASHHERPTYSVCALAKPLVVFRPPLVVFRPPSQKCVPLFFTEYETFLYLILFNGHRAGAL
jgi:hypothetical protein